DASTRWRLAVFVIHTVLAGVLVWVNAVYGVFAYIGFLFAYGLGPRWRTAGFAVTALVVSAALAGGYPSTRLGHTLAYVLIAGVMLALVLTTSSFTPRGGAEQGAGTDDRGARRGEATAGGVDGGERETALPAPRAGAGGRRRRGASAARRGDPRHARAGPHRRHCPAGGRRAYPTPPRGVVASPVPGPFAGQVEPHRGPAFGAGAAARAARRRRPARGARHPGPHLVGA